MFGRRRLAGGTRRARRGGDARGQGTEDWIEVLHDCVLATDHMAVATFEAPDATADPDIDVVQPLCFQFPGTANVVVIVGITALDDDVLGFEQ